MVAISVQDNLKEVTRGLKQFRRQIPFATSKALNKTANIARDDLQDLTRKVFSAPTRFTQKPIWVNYSSKNNLRASVTLKDVQHKYLDAEIQGGARRLKRYELHLKIAGLLPAGMYTVPAKGTRRNKFGNIARGAITRMLSNIQAHPDPLLNTPRTYATGKTSNKKYFVARIRGVMGVWERRGKRGIKLFLLFVKHANYTKRYNYRRTVRITVKKHFNKQFTRAFNAAVLTAR